MGKFKGTVKQDYLQAMDWYTKAVDSGYGSNKEKATKALNRVEKQVSWFAQLKAAFLEGWNSER